MKMHAVAAFVAFSVSAVFAQQHVDQFGPEPPTTKANWLVGPTNRWGWKHFSELATVAVMTKGSGDAARLPVAEHDHDVDSIVFTAHDNQTGLAKYNNVSWVPVNRTFGEMVERTFTDAIVILWKGMIIYEKYFDGQTENTHHLMMSCTKSFAGVMAAMLADEGLLDPDKLVTDYVPEMSVSGVGDATVRQIMDMSADFRYYENVDDITSDVVQHISAMDFAPTPENYTGPTNCRDFLTTLQKEADEPHGVKFTYRTANTDILGWIIERVLDKGNGYSTTYFSDKIWTKLGSEHDALMAVDPTHFPVWSGGIQITARDAARFGEIMRNGGVNSAGERLVPQAVVDDIVAGGSSKNVEEFAQSLEGQDNMPLQGWAYRDQFWVKPDHIFTHIGTYGQWIWVDTKADLVIAKQSTFPTGEGWINDDETVQAFLGLGKHFENMEEPEADKRATPDTTGGTTGTSAASSCGGTALVMVSLLSLLLGHVVM